MTNYARTLGALVLALTLCLVESANAAPISFSFSGTWNFVSPELTPLFSAGQAFSGTFSYESSTGPTPGSDTGLASYNALTSFTATSSSYTASLLVASGASESIGVVNHSPFSAPDIFQVQPSAVAGLNGGQVGGLPLNAAFVELQDSTGSAFVSAIPLPTMLNLSSFTFTRFSFVFGSGASVRASGPLNTLAPAPTPVPIPEPTSILLIGSGLALASLSRRRKR